MANQTYASGSVTVATTATKICTVPAENDGVIINATAAVVIGGPGVTATAGFPMTAGQTLTIPSAAGVVHDLYGIVATTSTTVAYLFPVVGATQSG
jgi:hypothetical protein